MKSSKIIIHCYVLNFAVSKNCFLMIKNAIILYEKLKNCILLRNHFSLFLSDQITFESFIWSCYNVPHILWDIEMNAGKNKYSEPKVGLHKLRKSKSIRLYPALPLSF